MKYYLTVSIFHLWASQVMLVVKNPLANAGDVRDMSSILGLGRYPGGGHGNPPQYSCLENPMDRRAWRATVHGVTKSQTWLSNWHSLQHKITQKEMWKRKTSHWIEAQLKLVWLSLAWSCLQRPGFQVRPFFEVLGRMHLWGIINSVWLNSTGVSFLLKACCSRTVYKESEWSCSVASNSVTPWTRAHQAPLSMGFSRQEYWSG